MTERAKAFFINGGAGRMIASIPAFELYEKESDDKDSSVGDPEVQTTSQKIKDYWKKKVNFKEFAMEKTEVEKTKANFDKLEKKKRKLYRNYYSEQTLLRLVPFDKEGYPTVPSGIRYQESGFTRSCY